MPDTKSFVTALMAKAATVVPSSYYEDGAKDAPMPCVVFSVRILDSDESTVTAMIEAEHWHTDQAGHAVELEDQCDTMRGGLDKAILYVAGKFRAVIWFEGQNLIPELEIELIHRQQTYQARIYYET